MRHALFATHNIRGFGLLQRDRHYDDYAEMFNLYNEVPSLWVKPKGDWGDGEVHLVELPTTAEGNDNIVAFWNPKVTPPPMQPFRFGYQILWTRETDFHLSENRVVATRIGLDPPSTTRRQVHLDFAGPALTNTPATTPPTAVVHCSENAKITESQAVWNPLISAWRVVLKFEPEPNGKDPVELRCTLQKDGQPVSETWDYLWSPP
jgi:glucans biosynthesis protein